MCINNIKKKDRATELIKKNQRLFKCPICNGTMFISDRNSLTCDSKHCFDLSKKGYLNLLTSSNVPIYSKELFEARHMVCRVGFYDPLINELSNIISQYQNRICKEKITILDA